MNIFRKHIIRPIVKRTRLKRSWIRLDQTHAIDDELKFSEPYFYTDFDRKLFYPDFESLLVSSLRDLIQHSNKEIIQFSVIIAEQYMKINPSSDVSSEFLVITSFLLACKFLWDTCPRLHYFATFFNLVPSELIALEKDICTKLDFSFHRIFLELFSEQN